MKLASGRIFRKSSHYYKISMTLFVLEKENYLEKITNGRYCRVDDSIKVEELLKKMVAEYNKGLLNL